MIIQFALLTIYGLYAIILFKALYNIKGIVYIRFCAKVISSYTIIYNTTLQSIYICYDNKVKIPQTRPSNHQTYKYYGVVMRFTYDFHDYQSRVENNEINHCMQRRLKIHARRLWIIFALTNDWESHSSTELLVELYNRTHSALINLTAVVAILQPCTAWIKELLVNPTFHFLHLPRRWFLCDGAMHHCMASLL